MGKKTMSDRGRKRRKQTVNWVGRETDKTDKTKKSLQEGRHHLAQSETCPPCTTSEYVRDLRSSRLLRGLKTTRGHCSTALELVWQRDREERETERRRDRQTDRSNETCSLSARVSRERQRKTDNMPGPESSDLCFLPRAPNSLPLSGNRC